MKIISEIFFISLFIDAIGCSLIVNDNDEKDSGYIIDTGISDDDAGSVPDSSIDSGSDTDSESDSGIIVDSGEDSGSDSSIECEEKICNGNCCSSGEICSKDIGDCCLPIGCNESWECGIHDDGCGNMIECGECGENYPVCNSLFKCVECSIDSDCLSPIGICTPDSVCTCFSEKDTGRCFDKDDCPLGYVCAEDFNSHYVCLRTCTIPEEPTMGIGCVLRDTILGHTSSLVWAPMTSCFAYNQYGRDCIVDPYVCSVDGKDGIDDGTCVDGECTYGCYDGKPMNNWCKTNNCSIKYCDN